ncbi:hypothetical protein J7K91_00125 [bacterium]|nr:hypothetical protein [bacterium]
MRRIQILKVYPGYYEISEETDRSKDEFCEHIQVDHQPIGRGEFIKTGRTFGYYDYSRKHIFHYNGIIIKIPIIGCRAYRYVCPECFVKYIEELKNLPFYGYARPYYEELFSQAEEIKKELEKKEVINP